MPPDATTASPAPTGKAGRGQAVIVGTRPDGGGRWRAVAAKELGDNLLSARFFVLLIILGLAAIVAVAQAASAIKGAASAASGSPSPFLLLFTAAPSDMPSLASLIGFAGPLLGLAFTFDAINNERAQRTLPRLVSQPLHRDDIINGKFVAGLAVVGIGVVVIVAIVAGVGILRLGIVPSPDDIARLLLYMVVTIVYIGVWMAFALLCSVLARRAATSALTTIAVWLVLTLFGALLAGLLANVVAPAGSTSSTAAQVRNAQVENTLSMISPLSLYQDSTATLLNPQVRTVGVVVAQQADQAIPGTLSLPQSLLVVWPQTVALVAVLVIIFAIGYLVFLRQEIRA